jgi:hypothetical protein
MPPILRRSSLKRCVPPRKTTSTSTPQRLVTCAAPRARDRPRPAHRRG